MTRLTAYDQDGWTFDVTDAGPLDGEAVVLLHGFPANRTSWDEVAPLLHAAGLRTLAPDQRGYSPRARPRDIAAYTLDHLAADVIALLDAAGIERAHVAGHDWGGGVAWALAGGHPERIASLTSLATPHPTALKRALRQDRRQAAMSAYMGFFQLPGVPEAVLRRVFVPWLTRTGLPHDIAIRYAAHHLQPGALTGPLNWYRAMRRPAGTLHRCRVPATYVWGSHDVALGRTAAELTAEHIAPEVQAEYRFVEVAAGHWLPEKHPDLSARHIIERVTAH